MSEVLSNQRIEQTPREVGVLSNRSRRSSFAGRKMRARGAGAFVTSPSLEPLIAYADLWSLCYVYGKVEEFSAHV